MKLLRPRSRAFPSKPSQLGHCLTVPVTYIMVRGSLRIRSLTPWSAKDRERKVDSIIPGKLLGGDTAACQRGRATATTRILTGEAVRNDGFQVDDKIPDSGVRILLCEPDREAHLRISNKVNFRRNSPSILTDRSPKTKNPPSMTMDSQQMRLRGKGQD